MVTTKDKLLYIYFIVCCLLTIVLGSIRGAPIFGKLDFLLLESKPWWPDWKPAVESLLQQGDKQPILSDPVTSTVLRGVFGQSTVYKRKNIGRVVLSVEHLDELNAAPYVSLPVGPVSLLLGKNYTEKKSINKIFMKLIEDENIAGPFVGERPYRCFVNFKGFDPSWVPAETRHWRSRTAHTKWFYRMKNTHVRDMPEKIKDNPLKNCLILK